MVHAATHCELESELHVRETGQLYIARNLSARKLCSKAEFMNNSNTCASENIIGPISDVKHTSKNAKDAADEESNLTEDGDEKVFDEDDDLQEDEPQSDSQDGGRRRNRILRSGGSYAEESSTFEEGDSLTKKTEIKPNLGSENLFFLTDQEYFHTQRFEYLSSNERRKGFVFGLLVPELKEG